MSLQKSSANAPGGILLSVSYVISLSDQSIKKIIKSQATRHLINSDVIGASRRDHHTEGLQLSPVRVPINHFP